MNRLARPALERQYLSWERMPLDADAMHRAAQVLVGENDFSAFRTVHCQSPHAMRNLHAISVVRQGERVVVETARLFVEGNEFGGAEDRGIGGDHGIGEAVPFLERRAHHGEEACQFLPGDRPAIRFGDEARQEPFRIGRIVHGNDLDARRGPETRLPAAIGVAPWRLVGFLGRYAVRHRKIAEH